MMTRKEHVEWCKERAREYLDAGDPANAITSMMSDMEKHPDCGVPTALIPLAMMATKSVAEARRFVEGFN